MVLPSWVGLAALLSLALTIAAAPGHTDLRTSSTSRRSFLGRKKSINTFSNPLIAGLQVHANDIRVPTRTKRQACAEPGPSGTCTQCSSGLTLCSGQCVDVTQDSNNCDGCGNVCPTGQMCYGSMCCPQDEIGCDGQCVNAGYNDRCGTCAQDCLNEDGFVCSAPPGGTGPWGWQYECTCSGEYVNGGFVSDIECDGVCYHPDTDSNHCGSCNTVCPSDEICSGGQCVCDNAAGYYNCDNNGVCTDIYTDLNNCGACGSTCTGGQCTSFGCECGAGTLLCNGACIPCPGNSVCGSDGQCACNNAAGYYDCDNNGVCTDIYTDLNNCGACGSTCTGGLCGSFGCECGAGTLLCNGACIPCPGNSVCGSDGQCACNNAAGYYSCDNVCNNYQSDINNCGSCGYSCGSNAICSGGGCICDPGYYSCAGSCNNYQSDINNCGSCGTTCTGGSCASGQCSCPAGTELCEGACTNPLYLLDSNNCGGCGITCDGVCTLSPDTLVPTCYPATYQPGTSVTGLMVGYLPGSSVPYCFFFFATGCINEQYLLNNPVPGYLPTFTATLGQTLSTITVNDEPWYGYGQWFFDTQPWEPGDGSMELILDFSGSGGGETQTQALTNAFSVTEDGYVTASYAFPGGSLNTYPWWVDGDDEVFLSIVSLPNGGASLDFRIIPI